MAWRIFTVLEQRKRVAVGLLFSIALALVACSSHTEAPRKAAADLEGSAAAGMSYVDFGHKLQAFASAIALARREGASERALRPYLESFDTYREGYDLWTLKIECPYEFGEAEFHCSVTVPGVTNVGDKVEELASKYGVTYGDGKLKKVWMKDDFGGRVFKYPNDVEVRLANKFAFQQLLSAIWDKADNKSKEQQ